METVCTILMIVMALTILYETLRIQSLKRSKRKILKKAYFDSLTKLHNRNYFNDKINKIISFTKENKQQIAAIFLDLDGFKNVNDTFGHFTGDELLKLVAKRLSECLRKEDLICRFGGDEFVIILSNFKDENSVKIVAEKIIHNVSQVYFIFGNNVKITASVGIVVTNCDQLDPQELIENADNAMYEAKKSGKNKFFYYIEKKIVL